MLTTEIVIFMSPIRYAVSLRWEREQERLRQELDSSTGPVANKKPCLTFTIEDFHKYFCCCARRVGSFFFLLERTDGSPIIAAGPCWPFCTFVTVPLILVLSTLVMIFIVFKRDSGMVSSKSYYCLRMLAYLRLFISYITTTNQQNNHHQQQPQICSLGGLHLSTAQYWHLS
jgi:hypothetical protein